MIKKNEDGIWVHDLGGGATGALSPREALDHARVLLVAGETAEVRGHSSRPGDGRRDVYGVRTERGRTFYRRLPIHCVEVSS